MGKTMECTLAGLLMLLGLASASGARAECWDGVPAVPKVSGQQLMSAADAARFLSMASFGPTEASIAELQGMTVDVWLDQQFSAVAPCYYDMQLASTDYQAKRWFRLHNWWNVAINAPDQLRGRVVLALSEIMVISDRNDSIGPVGVAHYQDILVRNAFGNFRDLLKDVSLHPAMGVYLSMLGNLKPNEAAGIRADENFARELMQLFSIGLIELNLDGSPRLDEQGRPIPTYTQAHVEATARALTGWGFHGATSANSKKSPVWNMPMQAFPEAHDSGEKVIVGNRVIAAGGSPQEDLDAVIDTLFNHPNVGPFIGRRLIQRLVTSNPSPDYIERVARTFADNGAGVRGDMKAVISAILTDPEALGGTSVNPRFGKLREPMLTMSHLFRALNAEGYGGYYAYFSDVLGQAPLSSPSVFNFFSPDYSQIGVLEDNALVAPELQLVNDGSLPASYNEVAERLGWFFTEHPITFRDGDVLVNLSALREQSVSSPAAFVDRLDLIFANSTLPDGFKEALVRYLKTRPTGVKGSYTYGLRRTAEAISLVVNSPYYLILK